MNDPELPVSDNADSALRDLRTHIDRSDSRPRTRDETRNRAQRKSSGHGVVEEIRQEIVDDKEEEDVGYSQPKRSWFTSTAFPLIAGTFGPLASLFSICAIVEGWRVSVPEGGIESDGSPIKDPPWSIGLNILSLVLALIANLVLLFNFAHRIPYAIAQPITIILWYTSSTILIVLLRLAPHIPLPSSGSDQSPHIGFSQSFYSAIISATLYMILSTLLLINLLTSHPFPYFRRRRTQTSKTKKSDEYPYSHPPSFAPLTIPQRTVMLQSTMLTIYLGVGALVFTLLERGSTSPLTPSSQSSPNFNETLTFPSALYFADYTLLTIGLGSDFPLQTSQARGVLIPYALGGVIMLGLVVGSVRGLVVERGRVKSWRRAVWKELERERANKDGPGKTRIHKRTWKKFGGRLTTLRKKWRGGGEVDVDVEVGDSADHSDAGERQPGDSEAHGKWEKNAKVQWGDEEPGSIKEGQGKEAFLAMRRVEERAQKAQMAWSAFNALLAYLIVWFGGALVFFFTERPQAWTYGSSLYFTYTSLLTIGYGDLVPQSNSGRPFFVVWSLVAVPTVTVFISAVGTIFVNGIKNGTLWLARRTILPERGDPEDVMESKGRRDLEQGIRKAVGMLDEGRVTDVASTKSESSKKSLRMEVQLAKEITKLVEYLAEHGGGKHEWGEWENWVMLFAMVDAEREKQRSRASTERTDGESDHDDGLKVESEVGYNRNWTWLGEDGPLFSSMSETEWVLSRLCKRLEEVLALSHQHEGDSDRRSVDSRSSGSRSGSNEDVQTTHRKPRRRETEEA